MLTSHLRLRSRLPQMCVLLLTLSSLALPSCKDDADPREEANDRLQGDWEVSSWTLDGSEVIGFTVNSFDMEFDKSDPFEGEVEWNILGSNGATTRVDGDYEIEDEGRTIEIDGDEFDLDIDGDRLEISGAVDGQRWDIEARRD